MRCAIADIVADVRRCINLNGVDASLAELGDVDTLTTDHVIESKILEGVRRVHMMAPYWMLEQGHNFGDAVCWGNDGSGWVLLPDDFMRLIVFQMSDWERPVYEPMTVVDQRYQHQSSPFKGVRGNPQRPVCVLGVEPEGRTLEFYSCCSDQALVARAVYLPEPRIHEGSVDVSEHCYAAMVYAVAWLALTAVGAVDHALLMKGAMEGLLQ